MTDGAAPFPVPDADTQPFWDGIMAGRLRLQRCTDCGRYVFYPRAVCPHCTSARLEWVDATGRGTVHSYTVVHRAPLSFGDAPFVVALIELEEDVRMMTRLIDVAPDGVTIGLPVQVAITGEPLLPYFSPRLM